MCELVVRMIPSLSHVDHGAGIPDTTHWKETSSPSSTTLLCGTEKNLGAEYVDWFEWIGVVLRIGVKFKNGVLTRES